MIGLERGKVKLVPYQDEWPALFQQEAKLLRSVFSEYILQIEHIGSTAIVGACAKPIIDLMCVVASLEQAKSFRAQLETLAYEHRRDESVPDRVFFAKGPRSNRTHHLSFTELSSRFYKEKLLFRDYLRPNAATAAEYCRLKVELANKYADNRAPYTEGKKSFVERILSLASGEA